MTGELHIPGTKDTPDSYLRADGVIKFKGRAFRTDKDLIPKVLRNWLESYIEEPAEKTFVVLAFEYINTENIRVLHSILKILLKILPSKKVVIYWYYEPDDEDMMEHGMFISNSLNYPFTFIETDNIQKV